ncbi:MAG TPA: hypothetical protein VGU66_08910 [Candidatus Elarobacter sp.]|nr:hypothetical protein [Candidatus Elarobacter sp.]
MNALSRMNLSRLEYVGQMDAGDEEKYTSIIAPLDDYGHGNILVNWLPDSDEYYRTGFLYCAQHLADDILAKLGGAEALVYPMLYCFRHFMELCCKRIIALGFEVGYCTEPKKNHDLRTLWTIAREVIECAPFADLEWERVRIECLVDEFERLDKSSTALRYATNRDGQPSLGKSLFKINVQSFADHAECVGSSLTSYARMMQAIVLRAKRGE